MATLTVGCDLNQQNPADGVVRRVQVFGRALDATERDRLTNRSVTYMTENTPYLSEWGVFGAMYEDSSSVAYARSDVDATISVGAEITDPSNDPEASQIPYSVGIYQQSSGDDVNSTFYIDNVSLQVSTIKWEFSIDDGVTWYPIISVANEPYGRFMLPAPVGADGLRLRITGNNRFDWVSGYVLRPVFDVQSGGRM